MNRAPKGFTLIELMSALVIVSLLALMSYRGLGAVLATSDHVNRETAKWRQLEAFMERFETDIRMASLRPVRLTSGMAPAWISRSETSATQLEFSRFASVAGVDSPRRLTYRLNAQHEIELWLWPSLDIAPDAVPEHYAVLSGVKAFELQYLNANLTWMDTWPNAETDPVVPRAVRMRLVIASGEEFVRLFELKT